MTYSLKHSINAQRALLNDLLGHTLSEISKAFAALLTDEERLNRHLQEVFRSLDYCKYMYVLDEKGVQVSATVNRYGLDNESIGRDRSSRPYMHHMGNERIDFHLSEAYISRNKKRPSVTAVQTIRDRDGERVGFLGVDYDLRELPHSEVIYEEPSQWRQIKGDPAIRNGLFLQSRAESLMDRHIDHVMSVHESLVVYQGVHHFQIHFSSSRSTIWHIDDPYVYRILTMDELSDTDVCLAYPQRPYFSRAIVPSNAISKILKLIRDLRFADETVYLRSGSLNIVNGKIGLNFSCDGTHYLNWDEFLAKGLGFWFGGETFPQAVEYAVDDLDHHKLDHEIEEIAGEGCMNVNKLLYAVDRDEIPERLKNFSRAERDYIYAELKSIMDVYDGGVCSL
jgi:hypothetical protein